MKNPSELFGQSNLIEHNHKYKYMEREREIYFKELAHTIVKTSRSIIGKAGQ